MLPLILLAQSDLGTMTGIVTDPTGAVVSGANVTITNDATRLERRGTSNESGVFVVPNLPPGSYTVIFEASGFKKQTTTEVTLDAAMTRTINAHLQLGQVSDSVEVVASAAVLQTDTATLGKTVERQQIQNLMLNGRNPLFLAMLKPGVRGANPLTQFSYGLHSGSMSINGGRTTDSLITFDGAVAIRTRNNGTSIGTADVDTVQEVQVLTGNYNAEYGRSSAGMIRMVSRSGSPEFHGTAYEYLRNDKLDANTWSNNLAGAPRATNRYNQFGYNIGGPVYIPGKWNKDKSKLFFLFSQEWMKRRRLDTQLSQVPTLAMRDGDFSALGTLRDPETGDPFPNNTIPQARLSRQGMAFVRMYPKPIPGYTEGSNNYWQMRPNPENQLKNSVSIDLNASAIHAFRFRVQDYHWKSMDAFREGLDYAISDVDRPNQTGSVSHTWTISPTTVNELFIGLSADHVRIDVDRTGERYSRTKYGIDYPYIYEQKEIYDKIPTINVGGGFRTIDGGPYPSSSAGPIYTIGNNTTRIMGNHTWKFGGQFERSGQNDFDQIRVSNSVPGATNNQNGRFVFDDSRGGASTTGRALANAAMGLFTTYAEIGERAYTPYRGQMGEFYLQDSWRVTSKLKLEMGVRYSLLTPYYKALWGNIAVFDPSRYDPSKAAVLDPRTGVIQSGELFNGVVVPGASWPQDAKGHVPAINSGRYDYLLSGGSVYPGQWQKNNWQPRFGVAYLLSSKTVLRAGAGKFYARPAVADSIFLGGNPPFQPVVSIAAGIADNPGGGTSQNFPMYFMTIDPVWKVPSAWTYSAGVQREIGFGTTLDVSYVGRVGLNLQRERDLNQLPVGTMYRPDVVAGKLNAHYLRPYKGFGNLPMLEHSGRSKYDALQVEASRRFSRGLSFGFAYTLSKSMDNASAPDYRITNAFDDRNQWGKSTFDTRHLMIVNTVYQLPFLTNAKGVAGAIGGGWQLTGAFQYQTGAPIVITTTDDIAGIGTSNAQGWNVNGDVILPRQFSSICADKTYKCDTNFFFQPTLANGSAAFTKPANGTIGNQNRNSLAFQQPSRHGLNMAAMKTFKLNERHNVQFRADFFNLPNHPNWSDVNGNPTLATFGKVTAKRDERNIQCSLRYSF